MAKRDRSKRRVVKRARATGGTATGDARRSRQAAPADSGQKRLEPGTKPPIFSAPESDIIPGEVVLQLREDTAAQITESISRGPRRGAAALSPTTFGVSDIDAALDDLGVQEIVRVFPPAPVTSGAMELAAPMASTFRLTFEEGTDVNTAVERLAAVDGVEYAEPNRYRESYATPNDPSFAAQWGLTKINAPNAWNRTTGSPNVTVAVIDSGVDLDHPELASLLLPGTDMVDLGPSPTPPAGFRFEGDFQGRDNIPQDEVGHGTHVAGTIACLSNNGVGVAGVTWSCRLMPVKVLTRIVNINNPNDVRGTGSAVDIAAGIRWAVDNGARVLNLSLGGTTDTQVERDAIAYAVAQGAVVVAAMGNGFQQGNPTSFPAAYPDVIAVGAISAANTRAAFSQTGPHIDVVAPGVNVLSTVWDNGYTNMSGTSMASPHVAGLAALILSCNPNLTAGQVGDIIRQTAQPMRDNPADPVPNNNYGFGCIDAEAALNRACPRRSIPITSCPQVSTVVRCQSTTILCRPTQQVTCPSVAVACPSITVSACPRPSQPVATCPRPSVAIRCPSGAVCGIDPGRPPVVDPIRERAIPFGESTGSEDPWMPYDPYGEDEGGQGGGQW
jgi:serine protease